MDPIQIRESRSRDFDESDTRRLVMDESLWRLVEAGYIDMALRPGRRLRLSARTYIGRAQLDETTLEIVEKVPGETEALMAWATNGSFKVERIRTKPTPPGDLLALLATQYLRAVRSYASRGRQGHYVDTRGVSSLIGGRLRAVPTLHLRARGLRHLVAFDRPYLSFKTPLNRVILRTVREIETLSRVISITGPTLAMARSLAMVFEDCLDAQFVSARREDFLAQALELRSQAPTERQDMLELAAALLAHVSFERASPLTGSLPRAWFLDLGTLFETAVKAVIGNLVRPDLRVIEAAEVLPPMFDRVANRYRANPDIVVAGSRPGAHAVGDVKHKEWTGNAEEADIYQLLAHTAAFGAKDCFLIYAGTEFAERELGRNPLGGHTTLFAVDVLDLPGSLGAVVGALGISRQAA